eukprot:TRINITY_DN3009_c0_g1_i2.p4 TRINITY_DN3009_c0_g1~~TRINITY_DN3009_c0_g1_i2.p4  ORF type:complete len:163 (-),score=10.81 TRINITY_DN3009_c0_g1_i2:293-730(-)
MQKCMLNKQVQLKPAMQVVRPHTNFQYPRLTLSQIRLRTTNTGKRQITRMGLFGLGLPEVAVIAGVSLLIFGPKKLPEIGKSLGSTVKSFQSAAREFEKELKSEIEEGKEEDQKEMSAQSEQKSEVTQKPTESVASSSKVGGGDV